MKLLQTQNPEKTQLGSVIIVKHELDYIVKSEIDEDMFYTTEVVRISQDNKCRECHKKQAEIRGLNASRQEIANDLITTKTEHQKTFIDCQQKERELQKCRADMVSYQNHIAKLESEHQLLKEKFESVSQQLLQMAEDSKTKSNVYEVESILKHKKIIKHSFLVRWAGYGPESDSWVSEENLDCEDILSEYKKGMKCGQKKSK